MVGTEIKLHINTDQSKVLTFHLNESGRFFLFFFLTDLPQLIELCSLLVSFVLT